ncbi:MAG TPA: hypothetical protein VGB54_08305 [Allosphingosinicella sp.]|jgi:hypothetical protein
MTLFFADLVREVSSSTGAGDFVLGGALPGHRAFAGVVPAGARFHYAIAGVTKPSEWETGEGEIGSGGTLVRSPLASSAGGELVDFSAGLKAVALTVAAAWYAGQEEGIAIGDVAGLQGALDGKAAAAHQHDAYAPLAHDHGGQYAPANHDHDGVYAPLVHDHDAAYQPLDPELSALAGLGSTADRVAYFTGPGTAALAALTPFGRSLIDDGDAAAGRATLGLGSAAVRPVGTSGDAVPVLNGGATSWSAGASFAGDVAVGGNATLGGASGGTHFINGRATITGGAFSAPPAGAGNLSASPTFGFQITGHGSSYDVLLNASTGLTALGIPHGTTDVVIFGSASVGGGLDVAGELRCDSLRIDANAQAAPGAAATHRIAVSVNGTTYYLLAST